MFLNCILDFLWIFLIACWPLFSLWFIFDEPDAYELDNIVEKTIEDSKQSFLRIKYKCEYKVNFLLGENGEDEAKFTKTNIYRIFLTQSMNKMNGLLKPIKINKGKV